MVTALRSRAFSLVLLCGVLLGGAVAASPAPRQLGGTTTARLLQVTGYDICCTSDPVPIKALAALDLAITVVPGADVTKLLEVGVKGAAKAGGEQAAFALVRWIAGKTDSKVAADLSDNVLRDAFRSRKEGGSSALRDAERAACEACFTAGTRVATPHGGQAIESLHVGDMVLSENPTTGKVEAEAVQGVIQDPVSPLIAVELSDGSAITVTADHPFWLDNGAQSHTGRGRSETLAVLPPKGGAFICHLKSDSPPTPFL